MLVNEYKPAFSPFVVHQGKLVALMPPLAKCKQDKVRTETGPEYFSSFALFGIIPAALVNVRHSSTIDGCLKSHSLCDLECINNPSYQACQFSLQVNQWFN